ncbi:GNAT family N-acetyltransferase [Colwellia sp. BRX10-3]|uniref:GNAT family N-acetyltransferase n=1 Tax=Colwellia sp. BRX10-3 TaxID=2759844 RepID=UPI001C714BA9|nr:GNAT family N-acetyltransferase [Colwellia sp. BRX10-3]
MVNNASKTAIKWLLIEDLACLKEYLAQWKKLSIETQSNLFCSPEWILTWIEIYWQSNWQIKTIIGLKNNKMVAISPLYLQKKTQLFSFSKLLPLGQGEPENSEVLSEFQDVIIRNEYKNESIYTEIANQILAIKYDQIKCHSLLPSSNWFKILLHLNNFTPKAVGKRYLLAENTNYEQTLSKNNRVKWHRCRKKLENLNAQFIWVPEKNHHEFWSKLVLFHQQRWNAKGKLGAFFHQDFTNFHTRLQEEKKTRMSAILINGIPIVINYYLNDHDTLYFYQCGWNESEYANLSPGFSLHIWSIINNPLKRYDFMMGDASDNYKESFKCNAIENMYDIIVYKNSFVSLLSKRLKN